MRFQLCLALLLLGPVSLGAQGGTVRCSAQDEWGRYACARIVGHVVGPNGRPIPRHAFVLIRARDLDKLPDVLPVFERVDSTGHFDFMLLKYTGNSTSSADTLYVPITATWLDQSRQVPSGVPQPMLGADSVDLPVVFAPFGALAPADTVVFHLARPPANQQRQ
ncbi:MAG TPA: hypothetical protein VFT57_11475 [Gemmatimonadaceae bacterium]|nr:hypothetical protein [Gemmatimonadaceae bacterium]